MLYFKSILLPKLGNIVDMNDKPVNDTLPTHEKRIKKVMKKIVKKMQSSNIAILGPNSK